MSEINEHEAREILAIHKIERDIHERRSCVQIASDMGLIAIVGAEQSNVRNQLVWRQSDDA